MNHQELYERIASFAERATLLAEPLLDQRRSQRAASQLIESSSGAAANYRAAGQGRSHAEFLAKLGVALEEADESIHWLTFLERTKFAKGPELIALIDEAKQISAILGKSKVTARGNAGRRRRQPPDRRRPARADGRPR